MTSNDLVETCIGLTHIPSVPTQYIFGTFTMYFVNFFLTIFVYNAKLSVKTNKQNMFSKILGWSKKGKEISFRPYERKNAHIINSRNE